MRWFFLLGRLLSGAGRSVVRPVRPALYGGVAGLSAGALAARIDSARRQAIADGVRPVPPLVYRALLGYFAATLLQKCRFAVGNAPALTVPGLSSCDGDMAAITLGDVVLFKDSRTAAVDLKLWAHELTHVLQYQRWGVEGFAEHCLHDRDAVEREAVDNANRFAAWLAPVRAAG
jgi:hypothetical protein